MNLKTKNPNRAQSRPRTAASRPQFDIDYQVASPNVLKTEDQARFINYQVAREQNTMTRVKSPARNQTIEVSQNRSSPIRISGSLAKDVHSPMRASGEIKT